MTGKRKRRVPSYWWDFTEDDQIVIETDDPRVKNGIVERIAPIPALAEARIATLKRGQS